MPERKFEQVGESKRAFRKTQLAQGLAEKMRTIQSLSDRKKTRSGQGRSAAKKSKSHRFGGRSTAIGVDYEVRVAALIAVKMLLGPNTIVWPGISSDQLIGMTMQAPAEVDDIVVEVQTDRRFSVFLSVKYRSNPISISGGNSATGETIGSFVRQFLKSGDSDSSSRFIWVMPSSAGGSVSSFLKQTLDTHRADAGDKSLDHFLEGRGTPKKWEVFGSFANLARKALEKNRSTSVSDAELRGFLRQVYLEVYDLEADSSHERELQNSLGVTVVEDPHHAGQAWRTLISHLTQANTKGTRVTPGSLRLALAQSGLRLKGAPDFSADLLSLDRLTLQNLERLADHTRFPFSEQPGACRHVSRQREHSSLVNAIKSGNLLVTGEPGCGKSGLIHGAAETLRADEFSVVVVLAEDLCALDPCHVPRLGVLQHDFDEVLLQWQQPCPGVVFVDALDAARDGRLLESLRRLIQRLHCANSRWRIVASIRTFDLSYGKDLRELFPGTGVDGYSSTDFPAVAHFLVQRFSEVDLDRLVEVQPEIAVFVEGARKNPKAEGLHRSPFFLRLAAELIRSGVSPQVLGDWTSPALLMRKFWESRVTQCGIEGKVAKALKGICDKMVSLRSMTLSRNALDSSEEVWEGINELRRSGILVSPRHCFGIPVGRDTISFAHHLLHDYAIAYCLIPRNGAALHNFVVDRPQVSVLYCQSIQFALEEVWDMDETREEFWRVAHHLEATGSVSLLTCILGPTIAARRLASHTDLEPLFSLLDSGSDEGVHAVNLMNHLSYAFLDLDAPLASDVVGQWCRIAEATFGRAHAHPDLEQALMRIVDRLNKVDVYSDSESQVRLNKVARGLIERRITEQLLGDRRPVGAQAIEAVCRTFDEMPEESEYELLHFIQTVLQRPSPRADLDALAQHLCHSNSHATRVILKLAEVLFGRMPSPGEFETRGSVVLPVRFQTSDLWRLTQRTFAEHHISQSTPNPELLTKMVCTVWNAVVHQRSASREESPLSLGSFLFRDVDCELVEDYSHIWATQHETAADQILSHFKERMRDWATSGDLTSINKALDCFAAQNRTALLWNVLMVLGAEFVESVGMLLRSVLEEPVFLTHPDYRSAGADLFNALHNRGDTAQRRSLEHLIVSLSRGASMNALALREGGDDVAKRAQLRLLSSIAESDLVVPEVRELKTQSRTSHPESSHVRDETSLAELSPWDESGLNQAKDGEGEGLISMWQALMPLIDHRRESLTGDDFELHWPAVVAASAELTPLPVACSDHEQSLWGHLVCACSNLAQLAPAAWSAANENWKEVRRVLLLAASDASVDVNDGCTLGENEPTWGWPAPRVDAACGLPALAQVLGSTDDEMRAALRHLCRHKSYAVRFNLADRLGFLWKPDPELMWWMIDSLVAEEQSFHVLARVVEVLDDLWDSADLEVPPRLTSIVQRLSQEGPPDQHPIHAAIASAYLFRFLRTGDGACGAYISNLLSSCDTGSASHSIMLLLHSCRDGGWLASGHENGEPMVHERTWGFFKDVLTSAERKLSEYRADVVASSGVCQTDGTGWEGGARRTVQIVDAVAMQLFFASGAFVGHQSRVRIPSTPPQLRRFWKDASDLLVRLSNQPYPHVTHHLIATLLHLLSYAPSEIFLIAVKAVRSSAKMNYQNSSIAIEEVERLVRCALAEHRGMFQGDTAEARECLNGLIEVLGLFIAAGSKRARHLAFHLEEIYK